MRDDIDALVDLQINQKAPHWWSTCLRCRMRWNPNAAEFTCPRCGLVQ